VSNGPFKIKRPEITKQSLLILNSYFQRFSDSDIWNEDTILERGDVALEEWVPVRARIHALADEASTRALMNLFPGARLDVNHLYRGQERRARGRHKSLDIYQMIEIRYGLGEGKMPRYGDLLRAMFSDQLEWIRNPDHQRKVTEQNGRSSLAMAVAATELADSTPEGHRPN
jgi:hypothetical protein